MGLEGVGWGWRVQSRRREGVLEEEKGCERVGVQLGLN